MVPALPSMLFALFLADHLAVGWGDHGTRGPLTLNGMREWRDINVTAEFKLPPKTEASGPLAGCVGTRSDQTGTNCIAFCVYTDGSYTLSYTWPALSGTPTPSSVIKSGQIGKPINVGQWYTLSLETVTSSATGTLDGVALFSGETIRTIDSGFATIGANLWIPVAFNHVSISAAGEAWSAAPSLVAEAGKPLTVKACTPNGLSSDADSFELLPSWNIKHIASGLCVEYDGSSLSLATCDPTSANQQFKNDYTRIRNGVTGMNLLSNAQKLCGTQSGVSICQSSPKGGWNSWSYFPNTNQLRNQYTANQNFGPTPLCLAV